MATETSKKQTSHTHFTRLNKKRTISESCKAVSESDESSESSSSEDEENNFDIKTYRNFLASLFPSKYMAEKAMMTPSKISKIISNVPNMFKKPEKVE